MINYLDKIVSLNNLRKNKPSGQIATLLMLLMVAVLIFVLVTVNIGQISVTTTNLANAADSASLYLASQLGTKSRMLSDTLRNSCGNRTECCQDTGLGGIIGGIIGAIVIIVLVIGTGGLGLAGLLANCAANVTGTMLAGTVGGAIGGAIGGTIAGPGTLQGAIQGATVGAAIGGAFIVGGEIATTQVGVATSATTTSELGGSQTLPLWMVAPAKVAALGGGAVSLTAAASLYNAYVADKMTSAAFSAAAKALNGLGETDRIREGIFLQALSQTIDDPNMHLDEFDSDEDGDIEEKIPYFQYWWQCRTENFKHNISRIKTLTEEFFNGPLKEFRDFVEKQYTNAGPLCRQELDGADGSILLLARGLENAGYDVSFWKPGTPSEHNYDSVDRAVSEFEEITEAIDSWGAKSLNQLMDQWEDWMALFYDPDKSSDEDGKDTDYYTTLGELANGTRDFKGLKNWQDELKTKRLIIPECVYTPTGEASNSPCRIKQYQNHRFPGTIDVPTDDEFDPAIDAIDNMVLEIKDFRNAVRKLYNDIQKAIDQPGTFDAFGGKNPVKYTWADSRCPKDANGEYTICHTVEVKTYFKVPRIKKEEHSDEVCLVLVHASGRPWVQLTRSDPANRNIGILGKWNPFFNGTIVRKSVAYYRYDNVRLDNTR